MSVPTRGRGAVKPRGPLKPRWNHPLCRGMLNAYVFNEWTFGTDSPNIPRSLINPTKYPVTRGGGGETWRRSSARGGGVIGTFGSSSSWWKLGNQGGLSGLQIGSIVLAVCINPEAVLSIDTTFHSCAAEGFYQNQGMLISGHDPTTGGVIWQPYGGNSIIGATPVLAKRWRHIVVTYATGNHHLYLDGKLDGTGTTAGSMSTTNSPIALLGSLFNDSTDTARALYDHWYLYNRPISAQEANWLATDWYAPFVEAEPRPLWFLGSGITPPAGAAGGVFRSGVFAPGVFGGV